MKIEYIRSKEDIMKSETLELDFEIRDDIEKYLSIGVFKNNKDIIESYKIVDNRINQERIEIVNI